MIISRISLAAAALALAAWGAQAQTGDTGGDATAPPRALNGPPSGEQPPDVSTDDLQSDVPEPAKQPPAASGDQPSERPQTPRAQSVDTVPLAPPEAPKPQIEVNALGTIDGAAAGLLDPGNGGFDSNMWAGSTRGAIEALLSRVPLATSDSAVRALARRLVLTKADTPPGSGKRSLLAIRIGKLLEAGMIDDAGALAAAAQVKDDPDLARVQADAILIAGRAGDACSDKTALRQTQGDLFWLELRAYCAAASGDGATADLTRSVIDAQGLTDGAYNILAGDVLTGAQKPPGPIAKPNALHLFLLRKAGLPIGDKLAATFGTSAELLLLRDPRNPPEARLAIAEHLVRTGAVGVVELKAIADAQAITADRTANAAAAAPKLPFLAGQVLLRRAAQLESRLATKAALVHQALTLGDKAGLFEIASNLQADVAASIDAVAAPAGRAPLIGWSLLLAGKSAAAAHWLGDNDAAKAVLDLVAGRDDGPQAALGAIAAHVGTDPMHPDSAHAIEALLLGVSDALGRPMPSGAKAAAATAAAGHWPGRRPDDAAMQAMVQAAAAPDRKGEAVLRILDIVGAKGPGDLAPDITIEMVRALREMGLKDAARALAIHALLLYRPAAP